MGAARNVYHGASVVGTLDAWGVLVSSVCFASIFVFFAAKLLTSQPSTEDKKQKGVAYGALACMLVCCGVLYVIAVHKSKPFAAAAGVSALV